MNMKKERGDTVHKNRDRLRFMGFSAMMAAVLCVLCPITVPLGMVPITLSVFALFLVASLLPMRVALSATAVYLVLGAVGLPVFSSFTGGAFSFVSPSGGFLWGYLPAVFVVSFFAEKSGGRLSWVWLGTLLGLLALYAFGVLGFCVFAEAGLGEALLAAVLPFLLPDAVKILLVLAFFPLLYPRLSKRLLKSDLK